MQRVGKLEDHPAVKRVRARERAEAPGRVTLEVLRALAKEAGADDVAAVLLDHPDVAEERPTVLRALPSTRTLIALVVRMHPDNVRSPSRSVANLEFHRAGHAVDEAGRHLAVALSALGHHAINPSMAFPMEMEDFPGRTWVVSHKRVAVAAQLGRMGLHRSVIHPQFGAFIVLGTVLTSAEVEPNPTTLDYDPCVNCKLCVAACPVGALELDGTFRFSACYDHNYREFMTGFGDLLEEVVESKDKHELRERVSLSESASMWQSLAYEPNYKAAHCLAVCPAGDDVLGPFLDDRAGFLRDVLRPLTERSEPVYVVAGSDAEAHVKARFPHKKVRVVRSSLRPTSVAGFFRGMELSFQRGPARGWKATFHFELEGGAPTTVRIDDGTLEVEAGLHGTADLHVSGAGQTWLDVVTGRRNAVWAVLTRALVVRGERSLLTRFAKCFPR